MEQEANWIQIGIRKTKAANESKGMFSIDKSLLRREREKTAKERKEGESIGKLALSRLVLDQSWAVIVPKLQSGYFTKIQLDY